MNWVFLFYKFSEKLELGTNGVGFTPIEESVIFRELQVRSMPVFPEGDVLITFPISDITINYLPVYLKAVFAKTYQACDVALWLVEQRFNSHLAVI